MTCKNFTLKKSLILLVINFFVAIFFSLSDLNAQSTDLIIDQTCINQINNGCPSFANTCNSYSGWTSSHGTPQINFWYSFKGYNYYNALMIGTSVGGEGMFKPFSFLAGQTYTITVSYSTTGDPGTLSLYAANNLQQQFSNTSCQESPQNSSSKQLIGLVVSTDFPIAFTANSNYSQYWMYASLSSGTQYNATVTNITITPVCNIGAPTGLGTSNNGSTLNWNVLNGASSYEIIVYDTHDGITTEKTLYSNTNSVNYCAQAEGDNVRFVVYGVCSNNALSAPSEYSYTYSNYPFPVIPTGLNATNITSTSAVLSWNAQPGVSFYASVYGPGSSGFYTPSNSYTLTGLQPNSTYYYYLSAYNNCYATSSVSGSFSTLPLCSPPYISYTQPDYSGQHIIYVYFPNPPQLGVLSYNLKYRVYNTTTEYLITNIPVTTNPYLFTNGIIGNLYQFALQSNCANGTQSNYSDWYQTPSPFYRTIKESHSSNLKETNLLSDSTSLVYHQDSSSLVKMDINNFSTDLILYPNPAMNELNISFENRKMIRPELIIEDFFGKEIMKKYLSNQNLKGVQFGKINVGNFSNGVYILKLKLGTKLLIQKFVIQR